MPKEEVKPPEAVESNDFDSFMKTLESAGIKDAKQLEGRLNAGSQAGQLANLYGAEKQKVADLETRIRELESKPRKQEYDPYEMGEQTIDIESVVLKAIEKHDNAKTQKAIQAQRAFLTEWGGIQQDEDYSLVQEVWEKKVSDPNFQVQLQTGQKNLTKEYQDTLRQFYKGLLKKSHESITAMKGSGKPKPPHVVEGGPTSANLVPSGDEEAPQVKRLKELRAKADSGGIFTEQEEMELANLVVGRLF